MTNKEAIKILKIAYGKKTNQALDLAIKALEDRPKGDLISREWLKDAFDNLCCHNCKMCRNFRNEDSFYKCKLIENAPTVEPENEWGKWIVTEVWCPKCHEYCEPATYPTVNRCPNCGANMQKGGAE